MSDGPAKEMPKYKCHKEVHALRIAAITFGANAEGAHITPVDDGYAPFPVTEAFIEKHDPEAGGYYVVYADGYASYSPAKAFEEGYSRIG